MKQYILKLKTDSTTNYAVYDGTTALTDAELTTLFTTAGSAYFNFDFNSLTPSATDAITIVNSSDTAVVTNTGLTDTIVETKDFKGAWSASATTFDTFTALGGVSMDEAQLSDLMGKIKNAGPTVVQTTGTSTTDVMSQAAATDMIWPGNNTTKTIIDKGPYTSVGDRTVRIGRTGASNYWYGNDGIYIGANQYATSTTGNRRNYETWIGCEAGRKNVAVNNNTNYSTAIGYNTTVEAQYATAIGTNSKATMYGAVGIGGGNSSNQFSIAMGIGSVTTRDREVSVGKGTGTDPTRYIANVTDPSLPQDAATKNYVDTKLTYTTTEQVVGTWIDSKPIYRRVVQFGSNELPSNSSVNIADVSSWNIDMAVSIRGMVGYQTGHGSQSVSFRPLTLAGGGTDDIRIDIDQEKLRIRTYSSWAGFDRNFIIVEYTKTTDAAS